MIGDEEESPLEIINNVINDELEEVQIDVQLTCYPTEEILQIKDVMLKDKHLREIEMKRRRKLDDGLEESMLSFRLNDVGSEDTYCPLCSEKFSMIMNKKKFCLICEKGFCGNCLYKFYKNNVEVCKVCFLQSIRDGKTGRWFNSQSENNGRLRRSASVVIMSSIRRIKTKLAPNQNVDRMSFNSPELKKERNNSVPRRESTPFRTDNQMIRQDSPLIRRDSSNSRRDNLPIRRVSPPSRPEIPPMRMSPSVPKRSYPEKEDPKTPRGVKDSVDATRNSRNYNTMNGSVPPEKTVEVPSISKDVRDDSGSHHLTLPSNLGHMGQMSTSMMSVYSDVEESYKTGITVSGEILFSTYYDEGKKMLNIYVDQCRNIAVADRKRRKTDPYIKTYLLPDRTKMSKRKSTTKKMALNPVFKETLSYYIDKEDLQTRTLSVACWHKSSFKIYNIFLGEVQIGMSSANLTTKECTWYPFGEKRRFPIGSHGILSKGEIIIKLKHKPSTLKEGRGTLHVMVVGARGLEHDRATVNSYVKGYLLPDKNPKSKQKTPTNKGTLNPTWNSTMMFPDVTLKELRDRSLQLSIFHQNLLKGNEFLGGVRLNLGLGLHSLEHVQWMDAQGAEKEAWEKLLASPTEYTDATINLRPNLDF